MADGDRATVSSLKRGLTDKGYTVDVALNGEHALWDATEFDYDAVLLDEMLPSLDGVQVAIQLRKRKPAMPILMLTADLERGDQQDDDRRYQSRAYADADVVKPIELDALSALLRAVIGTYAEPRPSELRVGDLRINLLTRQAWRADSELDLTPREYALLRLFLNNPGQVLSRRQILDDVWARSHVQAPNLVDQYVLYLRRKIDRPFGIRQLDTVRGLGYRLRERAVEEPEAQSLAEDTPATGAAPLPWIARHEDSQDADVNDSWRSTPDGEPNNLPHTSSRGAHDDDPAW